MTDKRNAVLAFATQDRDGVGTFTDPMNDVVAALAAVGADGIVAFRGSVDVPLVIPDGVALYGVCPTLAQLSGGAGDTPTVTMGPATMIGNLRVEGSGPGVRIDAGAGTASLRDLIVEDVVGDGIRVDSGDVAIRRVYVDSPGLASEEGGIGLAVHSGHVVIDHLVLDYPAAGGVFVDGEGTRVEGRQLGVRGWDGSGRAEEFGIRLRGTAELDVELALVTDSFGTAVEAADSTELVLQDAWIARTRESASGEPGIAVVVRDDADATLVRVGAKHSATGEFLVRDSARFSFDFLVVGGITGSDVDDVPGFGVEVRGDGRVEGTFVQMSGALAPGIRVASGRLDVLSARIGGDRSSGDGAAVEVTSGGRAGFDDLVVSGSFGPLVLVEEGDAAGATLSMTDVWIGDEPDPGCHPPACFTESAPIGVGGYSGAELTLRSFGISGRPAAGVQLVDAALDASTGVLSGNGVAVNAQGSSTSELTDVYIDTAETSSDAIAAPSPLGE